MGKMMKEDSSTRDSEAQLAYLRRQAKQALRDRMRAVRRVLPASACSERAARALTRLRQLPELEHAQTVVGYRAMNKELDPAQWLELAARSGKRVGLPRVEGEHLILHAYAPGDPLEESAFGMLEPLAKANVIAPDDVGAILVPALAVDDQGYRIGYGRAFYDRLLTQLTRAFSVGLVYDFQIVAELPREPHDRPVRCVISDARTLRP